MIMKNAGSRQFLQNIFVQINYYLIILFFMLLQVQENGAGKRKRKLSRSFIFSDSKNQYDGSSIRNISQSSFVDEKKEKTQVQQLKQEFLHYPDILTDINAPKKQRGNMNDQQFAKKYHTNPYFKTKVDLLVKKQKQKQPRKRPAKQFSFDSLLGDDDDSSHISLKMHSCTTIQVQKSSKEKEKDDLLEMYYRMIERSQKK